MSLTHANGEMEMDRGPDGKALEGVCVLVVDDNAGMRDAVRRFLQRSGCAVVDADTPSEARDVARMYPGRIDLALVDLILPEMSGPECADMLVDKRPDLKIAYMSGYAESVSGGFPDDDAPVLLQKPFARNELVGAIQRVLGLDGSLALSSC